MYALAYTENKQNNYDDILSLPSMSWLLEKSTTSTVWVLDDIQTINSKPEKIDLNINFTDGTNLQDPINRKWLELVLKYIYKIRNSHNSKIKTGVKHASTAQKLLIFLQWLRMNGFYSIKDVTPEVTSKFNEDIAMGNGYALNYLGRMQDYFNKRTKEQIPTFRSPHAKNRVLVDKIAILDEIGINYHSLSGDKVASAYFKQCIDGIGYERYEVPKELPKYKPLIRVTQKRYMNIVRALYIWRDDLGEEGLSFLPFAGVYEANRTRNKATAAEHVANIPPEEAMQILNIALKWIYEYSPKVMRLYDDAENFYLSRFTEAKMFEVVNSPEYLSKMHDAFTKFLEDEDRRGVYPWGFIVTIRRLSGLGSDSSKSIAQGKLRGKTLRAVKQWLNIDYEISVAELNSIIRKKIKDSNHDDINWDGTWPYSHQELARLIGIDTNALKKFIKCKRNSFRSGELKIYEFLVSKGYLERLDIDGANNIEISYLQNRHIEAPLEDYVKNHPLNIKGEDRDSPFPLAWNLGKSGRSNSLSLFDAVRFMIPTSALIVLSLFNARRSSEVLSLRTDCITRDEYGHLINTHIAKTLRAQAQITTVRAVSDAVDVLKKWGGRGRTNGSNLLFSHWLPLSGPIKTIKPQEDLNKFWRLSLGRPLSHTLQVRQFRRFFAITYFWRYRLGGLTALSQFLYHKNISMTKQYITEMVGNDVLKDIHKEYSLQVLMDAYDGKNPISGPFSNVWNRKVRSIRSQIQTNIEFVSKEEYEQLVRSEVERSVRLLTPTPGGACASRDLPRDVARAKCSQVNPHSGLLEKMPDLSTPSKCGSCAFAITDGSYEQYWNKALEISRLAEKTAEGTMQIAAQKDSVIINNFISKNFKG